MIFRPAETAQRSNKNKTTAVEQGNRQLKFEIHK